MNFSFKSCTEKKRLSPLVVVFWPWAMWREPKLVASMRQEFMVARAIPQSCLERFGPHALTFSYGPVDGWLASVGINSRQQKLWRFIIEVQEIWGDIWYLRLLQMVHVFLPNRLRSLAAVFQAAFLVDSGGSAKACLSIRIIHSCFTFQAGHVTAGNRR